MRRFINWVFVVGALVGVFYLVGLIVPRSQTQSSKTQTQTKPDELYALVADVSSWPQWHPEVARVEERPERNDHLVWRVTEKDGDSYELELTQAEEEKIWLATYSHGGSRVTLRFVFGWFGQGGRMHVTRTVDTRDPWLRARLVFWGRDEATPLTLLNAISQHLGEASKAVVD